MCRNIRPLFNFEPPSTDDEVRAAALQYVRKIAGSPRPSKANEPAFERAIEAIATASRALLEDLQTQATPRNREVESTKAKARSSKRFASN